MPANREKSHTGSYQIYVFALKWRIGLADSRTGSSTSNKVRGKKKKTFSSYYYQFL